MTVKTMLARVARFARPRIVALSAVLASCALIGASVLDGRATAADGWIEFGRADFTGVSDGPGDGKSHPAAIGSITTSTSSGKSIKDVASASGVSRERLVLSDAGTAASTDIGYRFALSSAANGGVYGSFVLEPQGDAGSFDFAFTDSDKSDFCVPGSAGDGATVEMCCIQLDDGVVTVGGKTLKNALKKGTRYRIEAALHDLCDVSDTFELWVTNLTTGEVEYASGTLGTSYKAVRALTMKKLAGKVGDVALDDFLFLAPAK